MGKTHAQWGLELNPATATGFTGELWIAAVGFFHDMMVEVAVQAVKSNQMRSDTFHESGLKLIGAERQMPRYPAETNIQYKDRLRDAWTAYVSAGNFNAIVDQLAHFGLTAEIWEQTQEGPAPAHDSANIWDWDDNTAKWSRFWTVITGHPYVKLVWGEFAYGDEGTTWGTSATEEDVQTVRDIIRHWKEAHVVFPHILIVLDSTAWDAIVPVTTGDRYDIYENRTDALAYWDGYGVRDD